DQLDAGPRVVDVAVERLDAGGQADQQDAGQQQDQGAMQHRSADLAAATGTHLYEPPTDEAGEAQEMENDQQVVKEVHDGRLSSTPGLATSTLPGSFAAPFAESAGSPPKGQTRRRSVAHRVSS